MEHPEIQEGEILLTNSRKEDIDTIGWNTKRIGNIAYDTEGNIAEGLYPVFVHKTELDRAGVNIDNSEKLTRDLINK